MVVGMRVRSLMLDFPMDGRKVGMDVYSCRYSCDADALENENQKRAEEQDRGS